MVKKTLIHSLSVLLLLMICLSSCSKKNEYTNVIPADASLVLSLDMKSMIQKSGLNEKNGEALVQKMIDALESEMSSVSFQQMSKIMKTPQESGISFSDRIYFFSTNKSQALVMKVVDESKLKAMFNLLKEQKISSTVESVDGFSWVSIQNTILCAFNKDVLLILGSLNFTGIENLKAEAKTWMIQKKENSIRTNAGFNKMNDKKEDITAYVSFAAISDMEIPQSAITLPAGVSMKDLMVLASVNFEKGRIVTKTEMFTENKILKKLLEEQISTNKTNGEFLDFFPANTLMFLNYSLNGEKLYNILAANSDFTEMVKNQELGVDVQKLLSSFDGDISIGVTSLSNFGLPTVLAYVKMKNNYLLELVTAQKQMIEMGFGARLTSTGKDSYRLNYQGMDIFMGMTGTNLYITNNREAVSRLNNKVADPITRANWAGEVKKSPMFFAINVAEIMKNPLLVALVSAGDSNMAMAMSILSQCSYIKIFETSKGVGEIDVVVKNQNENVLKQLIDTMKIMVSK